MQAFKWDLHSSKIQIQLARREARYSIVAVIILSLFDTPCPRCRSRLKPKIDVEGKIKVVKFLVSINTRRVHISAHLAFVACVSTVEVLSFLSRSNCKLVGDHFFPSTEQSPWRSFFESIDTEREFICSFYSWCVVQENHRVCIHAHLHKAEILWLKYLKTKREQYIKEYL